MSPEGVTRLQQALASGLGALGEIARRQAHGDPARAAKYQAYLRDNIVYRLGEAEQAGLWSSSAAPTRSRWCRPSRS